LIWLAKLKNGCIIKQHDGIPLDKTQVDTFRITESSGDSTVHFNADSGVIKFSNLNYKKLSGLTGGEQIRLVFDKENEVFRLGKKSLEFMSDLILKEEKAYFYIEFDQSGKFYVEGKPFFLSFKTNNKNYEFINQPPYHDFKYTIGTFEDFYMGGGSPLKKTKCNYKFSLGYNKEYIFDNILFKISHNIIVNILKGVVVHESIIECNESFKGSLYTHFAGGTEELCTTFNKDKTKYFKNTLTMI
jgi:hypothetical protein